MCNHELPDSRYLAGTKMSGCSAVLHTWERCVLVVCAITLKPTKQPNKKIVTHNCWKVWVMPQRVNFLRASYKVLKADCVLWFNDVLNPWFWQSNTFCPGKISDNYCLKSSRTWATPYFSEAWVSEHVGETGDYHYGNIPFLGMGSLTDWMTYVESERLYK